MRKKLLVTLIFIVIVFGGAGYLIIRGSYPVALANWQWISAEDFEKDLDASTYYYKKVNEIYAKRDEKIIDAREVQKEIRRAVLDKLIENHLVEQELKKKVSGGELRDIIKNKIEAAIVEASASSSTPIEKQIEFIYGLSLQDFKDQVLKPQAIREILEGRMLIENKLPSGGFEEWLRGRKSQARILILLPGFFWDGNEVIMKN